MSISQIPCRQRDVWWRTRRVPFRLPPPRRSRRHERTGTWLPRGLRCERPPGIGPPRLTGNSERGGRPHSRGIEAARAAGEKVRSAPSGNRPRNDSRAPSTETRRRGVRGGESRTREPLLNRVQNAKRPSEADAGQTWINRWEVLFERYIFTNGKQPGSGTYRGARRLGGPPRRGVLISGHPVRDKSFSLNGALWIKVCCNDTGGNK